MLVPEIQSSYAVLDWAQLHVSRSMRRWMRAGTRTQADYVLRMDHDLGEILEGVARTYADKSWLIGRYRELLEELRTDDAHDDFELMTPALISQQTGRLVAGELGYRVGRVYTSLTGFFDRRDRANANTGTLQLARLAEHLQASGFAFWNLGHPGLQYKIDLGARVVERGVFLQRWFSEGGIGDPL